MNFWQKINQWWLWLTIFALPLSTRKVLLPVFHRGEFVDYASISIFLSDLLLVVLLALWPVIINYRRKFNWGPWMITGPLLALAGWMWISLLWSTEPTASIGVGVMASLRFTLYVGFYLYLVNQVTDIKTILFPLAGGVTLQGIIAIGQYFTNHSLGLKWLGESVLDPAKSGIPVVLIEGFRRLRAHGTLPHANVLGGYLAMGLALFWPLLFDKTTGLRQLGWWVVAGVGAAGLFLSLSRSAWVAAILGGGMVLIWMVFKQREQLWSGLKKGWLVIVAVLILMVSQYSAIVPRWGATDALEQISITSRVQQLQEFAAIYPRWPLTGVGIGQYFNILWRTSKEEPSWRYQPSLGGWSYSADKTLAYYQPIHDIYLLALAELGPVGLAILLWLLIGLIWVAIQLERRQPAWGMTALWVIFSIIGIGLIDHYYWTLPSGRLMFMLMVSTIAVLGISSGYNRKHGRAEE